MAARTLRHALARLRRGGWIADTMVIDDNGVEKPGVKVAMRADSGFLDDSSAATLPPPCLDAAASEPPPGHQVAVSTSVELNVEVESKSETNDGDGTSRGLSPIPGDDQEWWALARELSALEYLAHDTHPEAHGQAWSAHEMVQQVNIRAIRAAMQWVWDEFRMDLDEVRLRFRAAIHLFSDRVNANSRLMQWWRPGVTWKRSNLERVLAWLFEPENEKYLAQARGEGPEPEPPTEPPADAEQVPESGEMTELAGVFLDRLRVPDAMLGGAVPGGVESGACSRQRQEPARWANGQEVRVPRSRERGLVSSLADAFRPPWLREKSERGTPDSRAMAAYVAGTTEAERAADLAAGRRPWMVGGDS